MRLFHAPNTCSQAVYSTITELGIKCEIVKVDFANKTELLKFNPLGRVPTLVLDDGKVLTEVAAILQYLADTKPEMNLIPKAGTWERAKTIELMNYVATDLHKGIGALFNKDMPEAGKTVIKTSVHRHLAFLNTHLETNKFLAASQFTIADAYCYTIVGWTKHVGVDMAAYPNILGYCERIGMRPAIAKVIQADNAK